MVTVLDGKGKFTVGGNEYILEKGETLIMPKGIPHAVFGIEKSKCSLLYRFNFLLWCCSFHLPIAMLFLTSKKGNR